jgi:hypothetical protein
MSRIPNARVYRNPRPRLVIEHVGGAQLGNCYSSATFRITSTQALSPTDLATLREAGVLGYGQEVFYRFVTAEGHRIHVPLDEDTSPSTGVDVIQAAEIDSTGAVVRCPALNAYSGLECKPIEAPFYVYDVENRVDSSG